MPVNASSNQMNTGRFAGLRPMAAVLAGVLAMALGGCSSLPTASTASTASTAPAAPTATHAPGVAAAVAQSPVQTAPAQGSAQASGVPQKADIASIPLVLPRTELVYEAVAELEPTLELGTGPLGVRRMVPISGGWFEGEKIKGRILPGGADRQLVRSDGTRLLDALYEMQTDDGAIITVHNKVMSRTGTQGEPDYRFSHVVLTAPEGKYSWVNQAVYVGTLHSLRPRPAVLIRVYRLY